MGKTGLTQKEAIFLIITEVAGNLYQPGVVMKPILWEQTDHNYGRARSPLCPFDKIVRRVFEGLTDGTIPSKLTSNYDRQEYASRIVHYWLKHDKRLNGGQPATRMAKDKRKQIAILERLATDPMLEAIRAALKVYTKQEDQDLLELHMIGRKFTLILETYGISVDAIPENLRSELCLCPTESPKTILGKKAA